VAKKVFVGHYMGGIPTVHATPKQVVLLIVDEDGVHLRGGFAGKDDLFSVPWEQVAALSAEGPDQVETRFTATRVALMGPFALAFKKDKKSDCFVVVELVDGEFLFQVRKKSQPELRADLAPWVRRPRGQKLPDPVAVPGGQAIDHGGERIRQLKDLAELRDQGVLTDEEFAVEKARVLGS
jgi:hypothetical protein